MPAILEPPKNVAPTEDRQPTFVHRIAVNVARLVVFVAIAVSLSGGWYLAKRGFGRQWRYRVVEELHKRGVEASIGRLTLDPFRGLVAKNVRIFDYKNREKTLARISEVSLDINYAAPIHHRRFQKKSGKRGWRFWNASSRNCKSSASRPRLLHCR